MVIRCRRSHSHGAEPATRDDRNWPREASHRNRRVANATRMAVTGSIGRKKRNPIIQSPTSVAYPASRPALARSGHVLGFRPRTSINSKAPAIPGTRPYIRRNASA